MLSEKPRGGLSETRKMTKSTMEKKRRARINNSLIELKAILSGMISNKGERFDKMEKADILEMTVKCVRQLQKQANIGESARSPSSPVDEDYRSGMHTCMSEVIKFISSSHFSDADPEVKTKLLNHLANKLNSGVAHKGATDQDIPYSYQKDIIPENNSAISNVTNVDTDSMSISDMSNDSNNNLQTINDKNNPFAINVHHQKSPSPVPSIASPLFTSYKPIQPVQETLQQPSSVPTVPLTILVPANICSATLGTTCVIPLNLPTGSPQLGQGSVFQTVSQPSQTSFTINSNSGISLIQTPNFVPNTQLPSKNSECSNLSPQNRLYTFTPTVLSNCNRTQNQTFKMKESIKPATVPFTAMLNTQDVGEGSTIPNINKANETTKEPVTNYQILAQPNVLSAPQVIEFPQMFPQSATDGDKIGVQSATLEYTYKASNTNILNESFRDKMYPDTLKVSQKNLHETDRPIHYEQGQFGGISVNADRPENRSLIYNRSPGNDCDNASDMWRPWKTAI